MGSFLMRTPVACDTALATAGNGGIIGPKIAVSFGGDTVTSMTSSGTVTIRTGTTLIDALILAGGGSGGAGTTGSLGGGGGGAG